jgi:hypothetical protein
MLNVVTRWSMMVTLALPSLGAAALAAQAEPVGATTPSQAVEEFIRAAADSNLVRMGELFGTDKGSFATTGDPKNWGQRAAIIQAALAGISVKALAETALERKDHSKVTTELARGACRVTLAVTTVKAKEGWLVREFDLSAAWDGVNRPCQDGNSGG